MGKMVWKLFLALLWLFLLAAPGFAGEVNLSIAASLKEVIDELSDNFARQSVDIKFLKNYGASGTLAKQIENGAPADIFISANIEWMEYLQSRKLMHSASIGIFTYNTLVFVGLTDKKVSGLQDLPKLEKIGIGSPKSVPAGEYAMEALRKAGVEKQLEQKLVMAKDVRECLMYAERGEVDGAFVYKTDAMQAKQAKILFTVPEDLYPRVTYPMGLTLTGARNKDAEAFYRYLQSGYAKAVLDKYGFAQK
ncbi:MAG: molybdate ABC transporter substrate-binding protein [Thermodesulfobacteriota bacterium]|jgi:molybdate transport system substrate-binding protein